MINTTIKMSSQKINKLLKKQNSLIGDLLKFDRMIKGSFVIVQTKCGKENCWCVEGDGHKHARISWREDNLGRVRAVPDEDQDWVKQMTQNNRVYKKLMSDFLNIQSKINIALENNYKKIIHVTKKEKSYLIIEK